MNRTVSAEESTVFQQVESPVNKKPLDVLETRTSIESTTLETSFECAICIGWLKDPVITKCGHRFCKSCLDSWRR